MDTNTSEEDQRRTLEGLVVPLPWRLRTSSADEAAGTTARTRDATVEANLMVV